MKIELTLQCPVDLKSDRFATGPVCLVLRNPKPFDEPIPARGQQGLWEWDEGY